MIADIISGDFSLVVLLRGLDEAVGDGGPLCVCDVFGGRSERQL